MSWNKIAVFAVLASMASISPLMAKAGLYVSEDELIVEALLKNEEKKYAESMRLFVRLFELTKNEEYLIQAAKESLMLGKGHDEIIATLQKRIDSDESVQKKRIARILSALYLDKGDISDARRVAHRYLENSDSTKDIGVTAMIALEDRDYNKAVELFGKIYSKNFDEKVLLQEVEILQKNLGDTQKAIQLLESHIRMRDDDSISVYFKLIDLYLKEKEFSKALEIYKRLYDKDPQKFFMQKIIKLSLYMRDFDGLISFLEKNEKGNEELLYMLYKESDRFGKAIALAEKRYKETSRPKWLAEVAILRYEEAKAHGKITPEFLDEFRKTFDRAIEAGADDSIYLNYYGYTLIDHNMDVQRGVKLVSEALRQQPENSYYLDSLAWGLYKLGSCDEAYDIMKSLFDREKIREEEIKMHMKKIRECLESGGRTESDETK